MYPDASDKAKVGTYPAGVFSGGGYVYDKVLEYRVWVHDPKENSDVCYSFPTYEDALEFSEKNPLAEKPLVLILQKEYIAENNEGKRSLAKEERIAEWFPEWLENAKRTPELMSRILEGKF